MIRKSGIRKIAGFKLVPIKRDLSPFSFFNLIFLNTNNIPGNELKNILHHEGEHIRRFHTIDIILLEIVCIVQWFNPFVWLYKHALREVHEFEADRGVIRKGENKTNYQNLILQQVFGNQFFQMVHNLTDHSLIKKRITMLTKRETKIKTLVRTIAILPIAAILVVVFSFTEESVKTVNEGNFLKLPTQVIQNELTFVRPVQFSNVVYPVVKGGKTIDPSDFLPVSEITPVNGQPDQKSAFQDSGEVFFIVEEMPGFQGKGQNGFRIYLAQNLKYPEIAAENGIAGKVYVKFIVEADGSVSNVKLVRGVDPALDAEAIRVVKSSPTWTPGKQGGKKVRVSFTFPINFVTDTDEDQKDQPVIQISSPEKDVFFIVEEMPRFQGSPDMGVFRDWLAENIRYPGKAREKKIQGKVYVSFIIDESGNLIQPEIKRGADPILDAEAIRVVMASPQWTPGKQRGKTVRVSLTFPITFSLNGSVNNARDINEGVPEDAFYVLDGKMITREEVDKLDPGSILLIRVLKGDDAQEKYGDKGKNGVVVFTTKNDVPPAPKPIFPGEGGPMFIINGKISSGMEWRDLKPDSIQSIEVMKGKAAEAIYGKAAKNGVVLITTKGKSKK